MSRTATSTPRRKAGPKTRAAVLSVTTPFATRVSKSTVVAKSAATFAALRRVQAVVYEVEVQLRKWGNSAAVRLPVDALQALPLELNQRALLRVEKGTATLLPIPLTSKLPMPRYNINQLCKGLTRENVGAEFAEWAGKPVGREIP